MSKKLEKFRIKLENYEKNRLIKLENFESNWTILKKID